MKEMMEIGAERVTLPAAAAAASPCHVTLVNAAWMT